jgi:rhodanese-related sulfurtransferase
MMSFVKDLLGGILIALVAGAIAVAQNAIRKDGIPLIPRVVTPAIGKEEAPTSSLDDPARPGASGEGGAAVPGTTADPSDQGVSPASPTAEELASALVSRERLKVLLGEGRIVLIDARPAREYEEGHIAGAISVPYEKFSEYFDKLTTTIPYTAMIVCYCRSETCDDSESLARELKFMGYLNVMLFKGGWDDWSSAGYPTVSAPAHK